MPKFVIERELPGAGKLTQKEIREISQKSCTIVDSLGTGIQWIQSFITDDKIYCIYLAANKELIKRHAHEGGFPANPINQVRNEMSPLTAEITMVE